MGKARLGTRLSGLSTEISDALDETAKEILNHLSKVYADLEALGACLPNKTIHDLRHKLNASIVEIAKHFPDLWGRVVEVHPELIQALEQGKRSFDLTGRKISRTVKLPHP